MALMAGFIVLILYVNTSDSELAKKLRGED